MNEEDNKTVGDQTGEQVEQHLNDIQNKALSKGAKKGTQIATNTIKKGLKAVLKVLTSIIKSILIAIGPYLLVIIGVIIVTYFIYDTVFESRGKEQSYQTVTSTEDNKIQKDDKGDYNAVALSKGNKEVKAFYTFFSDKSYYFTVGDDTTLYSPKPVSDTTIEVKTDIQDLYNREKMFYLSPDALWTLDEFLNNDKFRFPEQFIKPVAYDSKTFTLKQLADNGILKVKSQKYDNKTDLPISGEKVDGIWDYGFAPILHYEKYKETKQIRGKYTSEEYWDTSSQSVKTQPINEDYTKNIEGYPKQVYMIDKVISSAGTISNKIEDKETKGDSYNSSEIYEEKDVDIFSWVVEPVVDPITGKAEIDPDTKKVITAKKWKKTGTKHVKLKKYISANYYQAIPQYVGDPDTSQITGNKYFNDYFTHYNTYVPKNVMLTFNFTDRTGKSESDVDKIIQADDENSSTQATSTVDMASFQLGSGASADSYKKSLQYLPIFQKWGKTYGIDPYLLVAISSQESGGNHESNFPGGSTYNGSACGLMQIQKPGSVTTSITAFNFETKQNETMNISGIDAVRSVDDNIKAGAMMIASRIADNGSNILLSLQAYNMGEGGIENVVKASGKTLASAISNPSDLSWMAFRHVQTGDPIYIENVLRYYASPDDKTPYVVKQDGTKVSANGNLQTGFASGVSVSGGGLFDQFATWIQGAMKEIQKNFNALFPDYPPTLDEHRISYRNYVEETGTQNIINMMFVMQEKKYFSEYGDMTDAEWKEKYSQLFSNPLGEDWKSSSALNAHDYFPNGYQSPVKLTSPTIAKNYGNVTSGGATEFHEGVDVVAPLGTPIYSVADGKVIDVETTSNVNKALGKYVRIQHNAEVDTVYASLDTVIVKKGDTVKMGQQIGTSGNTGSCGGYVLHFELIKNGQNVDGSWVVTGQGISGGIAGPQSIQGSEQAQKVYAIMKQYLGVQYVWGGTSPSPGFDCSGLMWYCFKQIGVNLPRTSEEQQAQAKLVNTSDAKPGDLLFWGSPAHHVGMYIGNSQYIEAPHAGDVVKIATVDWVNVTSVGRYLN